MFLFDYFSPFVIINIQIDKKISIITPKSKYMIRNLIIALLISVVITAPTADKMTKVPGYPDQFLTKSSVYSGYLDVQNQNRSLHYVFMESANGASNTDPLTIWLNGGPGCSSLLGFLQEIGPYYLQDGVDYKVGDNLTKNQYSWHKVSNLLFLQSPAGVGFSYNLDRTFEYNDAQTAHDTFNALLSFYEKFPEYKSRGLWLAGQSYAGKYIPDLAQLIIQSNDYKKTEIKLKGVLIGNGIIGFQFLSNSQIQFMIARGFVDPQTLQYWRSSCVTDPDSAGCQFFIKRYIQDVRQINPYNVYGYCYYNDSFTGQQHQKNKRSYDSPASILQKIKKQYYEKVLQAGSHDKVQSLTWSNKKKLDQNGVQIEQEQQSKFNGAPCAYFDGIFNYFNAHTKQYNAKFPDMKWNGPCAQNITYHLDVRGSVESMRFLLSRQTNRSQIVLYNGNWDVVVPYIDTVKNIKKRLGLVEAYLYTPWFVNKQHAGFTQLYSGLLFLTVKGASHQVPQTKRAQALDLFNATLSGHPEFVHLPQKMRNQFVTE